MSPPRPADARARAAVGVTAADVLVWLLALAVWNGKVSAPWLAAAFIAVALPLVIATRVSRVCGAWRVGEALRCYQPRFGALRRCADHTGQVVTAPDLIAALCAAAALVNAIAFLSV